MNLDLHLSLQYIQVAKQNGRPVVIGKTGEKKEIEFAVDKVRKTDGAPRAINIQRKKTEEMETDTEKYILYCI